MAIRLYYIEFFRMVYVVQFILASSTLQVRFWKFNKRIEATKFDIHGKEVANIAQLYHQLCNIVEILNGIFTFHFIAIFANLLVGFNKKRNVYQKSNFLNVAHFLLLF